MNRHKQAIASSLLMMVMALAPATGFAHTGSAVAVAQSKHAKVEVVKKSVPVISGITAPTVLRAGELGTWTVKAFDKENSTLSYSVDWGDTNPLRKSSLAGPIFVQESTFDHVYDNAGTYKVIFVVTNANGMKTTSTVTVRILPPAVGLPVITNAKATSTKPTTATVSWKTDVKSTSKVWLSTSTPVNTSVAPKISKDDKTLEHKINLNKLQPATTYYVVVGSTNKAGTGKSSEFSFTTMPKVVRKAPVIVSLVGSTTIAAGDLETVTLTAFDPKNSPLTYSVDWGDTLTLLRAKMTNPEEIFVQESTFDHVYDAAGIYTAVFKVKNASGLETSGSLVITVTEATPEPDVTAPFISDVPTDISVEVTGADSAIVSYANPTALDDIDGVVPVVCSPASGSSFSLGTTTVACTATDAAGNGAEAHFNVTVTAIDVTDTIAPIITLNGNAVVNLTLGDVYTELGATATDNVDATVTVVIGGDTVNTGSVGMYMVTYDATDAAGNDATQIVRMVVVNQATDTTAPVISDIGSISGVSTSTISWVTNEPSNSIVFYSTATPVDLNNPSTPSASNGDMVTNHSLQLVGLTPNTLYHFVIVTVDSSLNSSRSADMDFTTNP